MFPPPPPPTYTGSGGLADPRESKRHWPADRSCGEVTEDPSTPIFRYFAATKRSLTKSPKKKAKN